MGFRNFQFLGKFTHYKQSYKESKNRVKNFGIKIIKMDNEMPSEENSKISDDTEQRENLDDGSTSPMDTVEREEVKEAEVGESDQPVQPNMKPIKKRQTLVLNSTDGNNNINDDAAKSQFFADNLGIVDGLDETEIAMMDTATNRKYN